MFVGLFIKFGEKENIEQLQKEGLLYCNPIEFFKNCENKEQLDLNENATKILQGDKCEIIFNGFKMSAENGLINTIISAPSKNSQQFTHLYCLFSRFSGYKIETDDERFFDEKLKEFGDTMLVIYNPIEFMKRLKLAIDKAYENKEFIYAESKRVEYVDFNSYHGQLEIFRKSNKYEHQSEWRLAILREDTQQPYKLYLGSLEDISAIMPISKCKNKITSNPDGSCTIEF